jgi:hypothetical protein
MRPSGTHKSDNPNPSHRPPSVATFGPVHQGDAERGDSPSQSEKLVRGIEFGGTENQHRHLPAGPVTNARRNQDRGVAGHWVSPAVELNFGAGLALQNNIDLGVLTMKMIASICVDLC